MDFLFDIGNVLLLLDFPAFYQKTLGTPTPSAEVEQLFEELKEPYETGALSDADFIKKCLPHTIKGTDDAVFTAAWGDIFHPNQPMWELVNYLAGKGHRLILFSNTNGLHAQDFLARFDVFQHFPHHHFSHEVGASKPDPAFYHAAIEKFDLTPDRTLYFDDLPENIATGRDLGFRSHRYHQETHQSALTWLEQQLSELEKR